MANLASLSAVKRYIQPDSEEDDQILADLVRFASGLIRTYTGRTLTTPAVAEERVLSWTARRSGRLDDKLTNITQVTAPYPYHRDLTAGEYELVQFPTVSELRLDRAVEGKVLVTGDWGWDPVPADLEYATIVTTDEWYRGNSLPAVGSRPEGEPEGQNIYLPREVQQILTPWVPRQLVA